MTPEIEYLLIVLENRLNISDQIFRVTKLPEDKRSRILAFKLFRKEFSKESNSNVSDVKYMTDQAFEMRFSRAVSLAFEFEKLGCEVSYYDVDAVAVA